MKYKDRVSRILDNMENQVTNLLKAMDKGGLSEREVTDALESISKNVGTASHLVSLEDNDFDQNDIPAPGSVDAPTPDRKSAPKNRNYNTQRVDEEDLKENRTSRVDTDGGHSAKKKGTKRVEFDENK